MLNFINLKPEVFGIDISPLSLKIAKLKRGRKGLILTSFCEAPIRPGVINDGEIEDEDTLAKTIRDALMRVGGEKLKTNYVVVSLPEEKSFLQVIQMPKMNEEELGKSVLFEAENYIPLPIEEVYLDFQVIKPVVDHLDHQDILICGLPRKIVDSYVSCLKKAGLQPVVLEVESQAITRALVKNEMSPSPILLVDFGESKTSFVIFSGYSLRFTFSIPFSSQKLTEAISQSLKTSLKEAEKLKLEYGLKKIDKDPQSDRISEAIKPVLTDLINQIKKYLDFYQTHASHEHLVSGGKEIKKIILCGGGANLKGLSSFLSSEMGVPVELGNPWVNISDKKSFLSSQESLTYTTALGLSLRGITGDIL